MVSRTQPVDLKACSPVLWVPRGCSHFLRRVRAPQREQKPKRSNHGQPCVDANFRSSRAWSWQDESIGISKIFESSLRNMTSLAKFIKKTKKKMSLQLSTRLLTGSMNRNQQQTNGSSQEETCHQAMIVCCSLKNNSNLAAISSICYVHCENFCGLYEEHDLSAVNMLRKERYCALKGIMNIMKDIHDYDEEENFWKVSSFEYVTFGEAPVHGKEYEPSLSMISSCWWHFIAELIKDLYPNACSK